MGGIKTLRYANIYEASRSKFALFLKIFPRSHALRSRENGVARLHIGTGELWPMAGKEK
jgi:hypothetical protein